jgi:hypothetical protein
MRQACVLAQLHVLAMLVPSDLSFRRRPRHPGRVQALLEK